MLNETQLLDEAAVEAFRASVQPELEKDGYHFFDGYDKGDMCIGKKDSRGGYPLICKRGLGRSYCPARPIEGLCLVGYRTFHPTPSIVDLFFATTDNRDLLDLRKVSEKNGLIEKVEEIALWTQAFTSEMYEFCEKDLKKILDAELLTPALGRRELSDYQRGALGTYLDEVIPALMTAGKDSVACNGDSFPFAILRGEYFKDEPRHVHPLLIRAEQITKKILKEKAHELHKTIFGSELVIDPEGYDSAYSDRLRN